MTSGISPHRHNHGDTPIGPRPETYRPDIDGLRAIAILSVVLYHAFPGLMRGGFVGVDIFFVISGFLITDIIFREQQDKRFSLVAFYARRVQRIFPALLVVFASCLAFGWFFLLADEYQSLGAHVAAGAAYISNWILMQEMGYFDQASELKPLLHLWSLAIEEQFYLVWPVLLIIAARLKRGPWSLIVLGLVASFLANVAFVRASPTEVFYMPFTRAWELLIGATLAWVSRFRPSWLTGWGNGLAWAGVVLVALAFLGIHVHQPYPGWRGLLPTLGAAFLIAGGAGAWPNRRVLATRPMVLLGLISYPLYLWHWPILSFGRTVEGAALPLGIRMVLVLFAVLLAWLTYALVERPLRAQRLIAQTAPNTGARFGFQAIGLTVAMTVIGVSAFGLFKSDGFPFRDAKVHLQATEFDWDKHFQRVRQATADCLPASIRDAAHRHTDGTVRCRQTAQGVSRQDIAILGDSHAEHLFWGVAAQSGASKNVVYFTYSCLPFLGLKRLGSTECEKMQQALEYVIGQDAIKTVVLANHWKDRAIQKDFRLAATLQTTDPDAIFRKGLTLTLRELQAANKQVVLVLSGPELDFDPNRCIRPLIASLYPCSVSRDTVLAMQTHSRGLIQEMLVAFPNVRVLDPMGILCPEASCPVMKDERFLYKDRHHYTALASELLGPTLYRMTVDAQ